MKPESCSVRTILVVARNINTAMDLQDRIVQSGYMVRTAYSLEGAMLLADRATLHDALIDSEFDGADKVVNVLRRRQIPFIFHADRDRVAENFEEFC